MRIVNTAIIGAGGWGTALAALWAKNGRQIVLWGHNADRVARMQKTRENSDYLPGLQLPGSVHITSELSDCVDADLIVLATPSTALRNVAASDLPYGLKRSLELGISLAAHPQILLLDEPTAGMGIQDVNRTTELISRLSKERMVIVVEHNLGVIADLAEEIDADEIIVGTRGAGRAGALMGSVAHELLHVARRPVTVIPERAVRSRVSA
jgi:nucleotide-binding universal stress UspA family protein